MGTHDCNGHGMCLKGECYCARGWGVDPKKGSMGPTVCQDAICQHDCGAHGHCAASNCVCDLGWKGPMCREPSCGSECSGHGVCAFWSGANSPGECKCTDGYNGA